jgi:hypothetical protein
MQNLGCGCPQVVAFVVAGNVWRQNCTKMLYRTAVVLDAHQLFNQYSSILNIIKLICMNVQI